MNSVQLIGRLTADPGEVRATETGEVMTMRIAVPRRRSDDSADFFSVEAWKHLAVVCAEHLKSGREIAVEGRLAHREWRDADGARHERVVVVARDIRFLRTPTGAPVEEPVPF